MRSSSPSSPTLNQHDVTVCAQVNKFFGNLSTPLVWRTIHTSTLAKLHQLKPPSTRLALRKNNRLVHEVHLVHDPFDISPPHVGVVIHLQTHSACVLRRNLCDPVAENPKLESREVYNQMASRITLNLSHLPLSNYVMYFGATMNARMAPFLLNYLPETVKHLVINEVDNKMHHGAVMEKVLLTMMPPFAHFRARVIFETLECQRASILPKLTLRSLLGKDAIADSVKASSRRTYLSLWRCSKEGPMTATTTTTRHRCDYLETPSLDQC
ncbi:hypothetical protein BG006_001157 [Podila minutissima]|uniref:Uncharacterized protein n=1 Tax=Podila minutissima TaxID=64525 RepID=A0A9P5SAK2_9FUNG|nr:hypothetical protein BG006_001157 [Podila minutissima]